MALRTKTDASQTPEPKAQRKPRKKAPATSERTKATRARKPVAAPVVEKPAAATPKGKLGSLVAALGQEGGGDLAEMSKALGWQPHTTRAAITRLRQRGFDIVIEGERGARRYRLQGEA